VNTRMSSGTRPRKQKRKAVKPGGEKRHGPMGEATEPIADENKKGVNPPKKTHNRDDHVLGHHTIQEGISLNKINT